VALAGSATQPVRAPENAATGPPSLVIHLSFNLPAMQVRAECEATGFLAVVGHGIHEARLRAVFASARALFDRPLTEKQGLVVEAMTRGRGYEISPEHREYMAAFAALQASSGAAAAVATAAAAPATEPSAQQGILSERFLCGPPMGKRELSGPGTDYYTSGLGPVFFTPDVWPAEAAAPGLREGMRALHHDMASVADAALALMAGALGLDREYFAPFTLRACSNLQASGRAARGRPGRQLLLCRAPLLVWHRHSVRLPAPPMDKRVQPPAHSCPRSRSGAPAGRQLSQPAGGPGRPGAGPHAQKGAHRLGAANAARVRGLDVWQRLGAGRRRAAAAHCRWGVG
jgi:hypothetical protein